MAAAAERVTDPIKQVTDARVLEQLTKLGIDKDYVEFADYDRDRPYSKLYTDRNSNQRILVSSGLPMVRKTDGTKLLPGFEQSGSDYWLKNNLFDGYISSSGEIHLSAVNDQPTGPIAGDELHSIPVLRIGGEIVNPKSITLLEIDPINPNYHDNVLEWDYGICKRQIRVIEGRFRGSWIFPENPGADARIEYNKTGRLNVRYGYGRDAEGDRVEVQVPAKNVEFIPASAWAGRVGPLTVGDSATFYPDANPETNTVDGYFRNSTGGETGEASILDSASLLSSYSDSSANEIAIGIQCGDNVGNYQNSNKSLYLFNTSSIPAVATITSADLAIYGSNLAYYNGNDTRGYVVTVNPASNIQLTGNDTACFGTTHYSDLIYMYDSSWVWSYHSFPITAYGISSGIIGKGASAITKLGIKPSCQGWTVSASCNFGAYFSEQGAGYKPKLTVTYSVPIAKHFDYYARMRRR